MKKKLLFLMLSSMLAVSVTACGKGNESKASAADSAAASSENPETDSNADGTDKDSEQEVERSGTDGENSADASDPDPVTTFKPVAVTAGDCAVTFTEIDRNGTYGYTIQAELENHSADKKYMFSVEGAYADSLDAEPYFAADVAAGEKSSVQIGLDEDCIRYLDGDVSDICLYMKIYNADNYDEPAVFEDVVTLYPKGTETSAVYQRKAETSDQILADNENVRVTYVGPYTDDEPGYTMLLYLENKTTDKEIMYSIADCTVNGCALDPFWSAAVYPGCSSYQKITFTQEDLEDNSLTDVNTVSFTLKATDYNDWSAGSYAQETVTVNP